MKRAAVPLAILSLSLAGSAVGETGTVTNQAYCRKAQALVKNVEERIGYGDQPMENEIGYRSFYGLRFITAARGNGRVLTHSNITFAIAKHLVGDADAAQELFNNIEEKVGRNHELLVSGFGWGIGTGIVSTYDSAYLAVAKCLLGEPGKAREIVDTIERQIGYQDGLIGGGVGFGDTRTYDNAVLATAKYLLGDTEKAEEMVNHIEQKIGFTDGLVRYGGPGELGDRLWTYPNTGLAIAYLAPSGAMDQYKTR
jgi:hypothetical protein